MTIPLDDEVRAWIEQDPDPDTRAELEAPLAAGDEAGLAVRFGGRLEFGTAGLRGPLGAGPTRMNRVVVAQAAAGLGAYVLSRADSPSPALVVGYDGRHNSAVFARDTCEIAQAMGIRALLLPEALPTPVLAFAIRRLSEVIMPVIAVFITPLIYGWIVSYYGSAFSTGNGTKKIK